MLHLKYFESLK